MDFKLQKKLVKKAMKEAEKAIVEWNSPFGAIIADMMWKVLVKAHNTSRTDMNPTAHVEMNAIKKACKKLATKDLSGYCLVSNAESCPMCMSAAIKAKIRNFIFGAPTELDSNPYITAEEVAKHAKNPIHIEAGILADECTHQIVTARQK